MFCEEFFDIEDFVDELYSNECYYDDFAIIADYDYARKILKEMFANTDGMPYAIQLNDSLWDGYFDEFYIGTVGDDIFCEKAKRNGKYFEIEDRFVFIMPTCSDNCVQKLQEISKNPVFIKVDFLTEDCEDNKDDNGKFYTKEEIVGDTKKTTSVYIGEDGRSFVKSWNTFRNSVSSTSTFSFYSDSEEEANRVAKLFDIDMG